MPNRLKVCFLSALFAAGCAGEEATAPPQPEPVSLSILNGTSRSMGLHLGVGFELPLRLLSANGDTLPIPAALRVESRNPAAISVDSGAFVTARAMGGAWIVASL